MPVKPHAALADLLSEPMLESVGPKLVAHARAVLGDVRVIFLLNPALHRPEVYPEECVPSAFGDLPETPTLAVLRDWAQGQRDTGQSCLVSGIASLPPHAAWLDPSGSACCAPLLHGDEELGVVVALGDGLDQDALAALDGFAAHAVNALANALLFDRQEALAKRDPLTGLFNHREFHEMLDRELRRCRRFGGRLGPIPVGRPRWRRYVPS